MASLPLIVDGVPSVAPIRRLPPLPLAIVAVVSVWALVFEVPRFAGLVSANAGANDFRLFYIAAEAGLRWGWSHMYDPHLLDVLSARLGEGEDIKSAYTYANPPLVAWIAVPLTALPLGVAFHVWAALNIAALVAAWWLAAPGRGFARVTVLLASLAIWPMVYALERGQPVLLVFAFAIGAWWMASRNRQVEAGILLALGCAIKPQDLVLLPIVFVLCGFKRAALWWLFASTVLWAIFAFVIGADGLGTYLGILAWVQTNPQHLADTYAILVGPGAATIASAALVALTLVAVWRQRRSWDIAFALGLLGTVMAGVHVHEYDYVGLVVAGWMVLRHPNSAVELTWIGLGVITVQVLSVGNRLPVLLWQPIWLAVVVFGSQSRAIAYLKSTRYRESNDELTSDEHRLLVS